MPQPHALRGALDQAGDVGEDQLTVLGVERAQHRLDGRERILGDLRRRPGEPSQKRRLSGVRLAHETRVGEQLEAQLDPARHAFEAPLGEARSLAGGAGEALVAVATQPAGRHDRALAGLDQVVAALERLDLGAGRHQDLLVPAARPVLLLAPPVTPALGPEVPRTVKRGQVAARRVADQARRPPRGRRRRRRARRAARGPRGESSRSRRRRARPRRRSSPCRRAPARLGAGGRTASHRIDGPTRPIARTASSPRDRALEGRSRRLSRRRRPRRCGPCGRS